jgi:hypothetical protein
MHPQPKAKAPCMPRKLPAKRLAITTTVPFVARPRNPLLVSRRAAPSAAESTTVSTRRRDQRRLPVRVSGLKGTSPSFDLPSSRFKTR